MRVGDEQVWDPALDPVLCSPYAPPDRHWQLDSLGRAQPGTPEPGRRPPIRIVVPQDASSQLALGLGDRTENRVLLDIRRQVERWRETGYRGATATTRRLLQHWNDPESMRLRPFYAQVEAIETLIWLREVATRQTPARRGIEAASRERNDGIVRLCSKMATGTGKTAVMGMVIAWQTLNSARSLRRRNVQHTDRFAVFAPGHVVRQRLGVLSPSAPGNVYDEMGLVPQDLRPLLNRARVRVVNYQAFTQQELIADSGARKLLGKQARTDVESWTAAVRRVLGDLITDGGGEVCVINDEAHHCYLPPERQKSSTDQRNEDSRASVWFNTIRSMRDMGALGKVDPQYGQAHPVLDFSATPLWIDTASRSEPEQFQWVTSDFGLMDAIESGLVKVPRVPIDDDSSRDETVWRKLYDNTAAKKLAGYVADPGSVGLPEHLNGALDAVVNDWIKTLKAWQRGDPDNGVATQPTPPVLIVVANNISNAVALYKFLAGYQDDDGTLHMGAFDELSNVDEHGCWHKRPRTLVVHSKVAGDDTIPTELKRLLIGRSRAASQKDAEAAVKEMLNTVGKHGQPGEQVRCVVSVSMLTEGWDARTVTHVIGFRKFSTQLLCEQVTGRSLRRTSYDALREPDDESRARFGDDRELFEAEYADVVGIPFEFMPGLRKPPVAPTPPKPRTRVYSVRGRAGLRVSWPNVVEYIRDAPQGGFELDPTKVRDWKIPVELNATVAELAGVAGEASVIGTSALEERRKTLQARIAAQIVRSVPSNGHSEGSDRIEAHRLGRASLFTAAFTAAGLWTECQDLSHAQLAAVASNNEALVSAAHRVRDACGYSRSDAPPPRRSRLASPPVLDTAGHDFETTLEHVCKAQHSELSHAACHSRLELLTAKALDLDNRVLRWARNFGLGWTIPYYFGGVWRRYVPDFVAILNGPINLIIECKGVWDAKATQTERWTRDHWMPSVAGTAELPDDLRRWYFGIVDDAAAVQTRLGQIISHAQQEGDGGGP